MHSLLRVFVSAAILLPCAGARGGAQIAFDSAADSAYNGGWAPGTNGGFGWGGGWTNPGLPYAIIGDSTTNGRGDPDGDGDINSPRAAGGRAWGLLVGGAIRTFSGPLSVGQTFSIDFDDFGAASANFLSYLSILAPDRSVAVRFYQSPDYMITWAGFTMTLDTGVADTDQGVHLAFAQLSSGIQVSITPYIAGAPTTVDFVPYSGQVAGFEFTSSTPGSATSTFLTPYINNISIAPEPSSAALLVFFSTALLPRRRRRA